MTDTEISKALALAIGWKSVWTWNEEVLVDYHSKDRCRIDSIWRNGRAFDYRDPAVIWPIAEQYDCFPVKPYGDLGHQKWLAIVDGSAGYADTAAKAVAIAVIGNHAPK